MQEYQTTAYVLSRRVRGEFDESFSLYCKDLGKVYAFAKSSRKPGSKLAGHLQPQEKLSLRLVEKNRLQIADALILPQKSRSSLELLWALEELSVPGEFDIQIWSFLESPEKSPKLLLKALGFDSLHAQCSSCNRPNPDFFFIPEQAYLCQVCAPITSNQYLLRVE